MSGQLVDKPASVFTSASSMHGGQEMCLQALIVPLLHHGMLIQGMPYKHKELINTRSGGTPYGTSHLAANSNNYLLSEEEMSLCEAQGERLASLVAQLNPTHY